MKQKKINPLQQDVVLIDGKCYRIENYPSRSTIMRSGLNAFKKGIAYRYQTDLQKRIYPYRGVVTLQEFHSDTLPVGIYHVKKEDDTVIRFVLPRTKHEHEAYSAEREMSVMSAVIGTYKKNQFVDPTLSAADSGGSRFLPPIHEDDDPLNKLVKYYIRAKDAPFEPYGKRLKFLAVEKNHGMEGTNIMNNTRRSLKINRTMSVNKGVQYIDTWEGQACILLKDAPDAMHPMSEDGEILTIFLNGEFEIDPSKIIDAAPLIEQVIAEDENRDNMEDDEDDTY